MIWLSQHCASFEICPTARFSTPAASNFRIGINRKHRRFTRALRRSKRSPMHLNESNLRDPSTTSPVFHSTLVAAENHNVYRRPRPIQPIGSLPIAGSWPHKPIGKTHDR
jgi:hypothetical protein